MTWPTRLRTFLALLGALALFDGAATQMIGHLLRYDPRLGAGLCEFAGVRFYAPWAALGWAAQWAPHAPWFALLTLTLVVSCMLAAYAVAILFAELEPIALTARSPWRDLANRRDLGDWGLLRDEGLLLGAVRRHALAKHDFVRFPCGHCLFLGDPVLTDDALIAALSGWRGPLVMIDARRLSDRLHRQNLLRVAPGRADSAAINPLLAIRGGGHAWSDARLFAQAFLRPDQRQADLIDVFALLMLDQLLTAPPEERNLTALRRRLIDKQATLVTLCTRWALNDFPESVPPAVWEMARVALRLRDHLDYGVQALAYIDEALGLFAEPAFAQATTVHHLRFTDLAAGGGPQTLVISLDSVDAKTAAPLVLGLLAQLAAACVAAPGANRRLLVVIEAEAARALVPTVAREGEPKPTPPLCACGDFDLLIQAGDIGHVTGLVHRAGLHRHAPFDALVSIGAQSEASAKAVSELGGDFESHRPKPAYITRWRRLMFPPWERVSLPRLPADALRGAASGEAFLLLRDMRPARIATLTCGASRASFISPDQLAPAPHDWAGPPLTWPATATPVEGDQAAVSAHAATTGAKLRRALTRSVTPKATTKPKSTGRKTR